MRVRLFTTIFLVIVSNTSFYWLDLNVLSFRNDLNYSLPSMASWIVYKSESILSIFYY